MPQLVEAPENPVCEGKRKRVNGAEPPKNPKSLSPDSAASAGDIHSEILLLENGILDSRKNYNNIAMLLRHMRDQSTFDTRDIVAAIALYRVFCRLIVLGNLTKKGDASAAETTVVQWLRERLREYEEALLRHLQSADSRKQKTALVLLMRLVREKATQVGLSEDAVWCNGLFQSLVQELVTSTYSAPAIDEFIGKYVTEYDDVRYNAFACVANIDMGESPKLDKVLHILSAIDPIPNQEAEMGNFFISPTSKKKHELYALTSHKRQAQKAWMSVLRQDLNKGQRKKILDLVPHQIAPWFLKVEMLMDFLTDSFNLGGSTSLMALSGLFCLVQQKNLDYPQFYSKLYSLLDANILHSKHRSRFFRLLDTFLASTHLPAALVASFMKRLSRLCLSAPPSGIVIAVPWIYDLLQNHPTCTFMIHRTMDLQSGGPNGRGDPFVMDESDPMETGAIESSLWEIHSLQSHYHPNVAAVAKIISEQFTKQAYNLEDFLDHSYATMLSAELSKDVKKVPEIEYEIPKKIFTRYDVEMGGEDSLLVRLWDFN